MKLYIGNCTRQRRVVYYRLDFNMDGSIDANQRVRSLKQVTVEAGKQVICGGDLHLNQIQSIMDQLTPVGGVGVEQLGRLPKHTISFLLSIDKQIPARSFYDVHEHNKAILKGEGDTRRQIAAVGANAIVERHIDATVNKFEVELEQMAPNADEPVPEGKPLAFGARIDKKAIDTAANKPTRGSRRKV